MIHGWISTRKTPWIVILRAKKSLRITKDGWKSSSRRIANNNNTNNNNKSNHQSALLSIDPSQNPPRDPKRKPLQDRLKDRIQNTDRSLRNTSRWQQGTARLLQLINQLQNHELLRNLVETNQRRRFIAHQRILLN